MHFKYFMYLSFISIIWLNLQVLALSQTPAPDASPHTASISGRVTIGSQPVVGRKVSITKISPGMIDPLNQDSGPYATGDPSKGGEIFSAVTDDDGRYRVNGLPAGSYEVSVTSLGAYVLVGQSEQRARKFTLKHGEEARDINFALVRGGVITGRLTDAGGRPQVGAKIQVKAINENGENRVFQSLETKTDDQGVYRVYGLPAGRYLVRSDGSQAGRWSASVKRHPLTYHPDATDEKKAAAVEVKEGSEARDINIKLGLLYEVTGRVFEAETGNPISQVTVRCAGKMGYHPENSSVDPQGNFRFSGLSSGKYGLYLNVPYGQRGYYHKRTTFEVEQSNVSGIEFKVKKMAIISGTVVVDNDPERSLEAELRQSTLATSYTREENDDFIEPFSEGDGRIGPEGNFSITSVRPGTITLWVNNSSPKRRFHILRVERDGIDIREGMRVRPGETITGIRVVLAFGVGVVRGQINFVGGKPPEDMRSVLSLKKEEEANYSHVNEYSVVNDRVRFVIEGLVSGKYLVTAWTIPKSAKEPSFRTSQRVLVTGATTPQLTLTIDLSKPNRPKPEDER
jgi:hypothetical protein